MEWDRFFKKKIEVQEVDKFVKEFYKTHKFDKAKILDLGCGTGRYSMFFAERGLEVFALDDSETALSALNKKLQNKAYKDLVTLKKANIDKIPYSENFFDIVISTRVLHHGYKKQIVKRFSEINRILKNDGFFIASLLSTSDRRIKTGKEVEPNTILNMADTFDPELPHHFFTEKEIKKLLQNFKILYIKESLEPVFKKVYGDIVYY